MVIKFNDFKEDTYYPWKEDFYHQLTIEAEALRELNEENLGGKSNNFITRLRTRWAAYFDEVSQRKVKIEEKPEAEFDEVWRKKKEIEWDNLWEKKKQEPKE